MKCDVFWLRLTGIDNIEREREWIIIPLAADRTAANHAMQLYDRMAEDTRVSKGIVELICANLVCRVLYYVCSCYSSSLCSCTRASSVKLVEILQS